jgi:prolyl 4-hydroxylase
MSPDRPPEIVGLAAGSPGVMLPMYETPPHLEALDRRQQAMARSYGLGFRKAALPAEIRQRLLDHVRANLARFRAETPIEYLGNLDHGTVPALYFEEPSFNAALHRELQPCHEEWSGLRLVATAAYGIRVYQRGSFLYNHVDQTETHVISSTICVDHRLDSPWPLYIEDLDGNPHQVNLDPGEILFYEGACLRHGRPYPLDGDYYASIFLHYRPASSAAEEGGGK